MHSLLLRPPGATFIFLVLAWNSANPCSEAQEIEPKDDVKPPIALKDKFHYEFETFFSCLAFSPDGRLLAAGDQKGNIVVWDPNTGKDKIKIQGGKQLRGMAFDVKGRHLVASVSNDAFGGGKNTVKFWEMDGGKEVLSIDLKQGLPLIRFHPNGKRFALAHGDGTVEFRDAETGVERRALRPHSQRIDGLAFSPDGKRIATGSDDKTVKICDFETGEELLTLKGHEKRIDGICFSPCGKWLASASWDKTVKIWDTKNGEVVRTISFPFAVLKIAFSPNGKWLALGGAGIAFSRDGTLLASASSKVAIREVVTGREVLVVNKPRDRFYFWVWEVTEAKGAEAKGK